MRLPFDYSEKPKFSVRNMSKDVRTTIKTGLLYPLYFKKLYPGDRFDLNLATLLQTNPLMTPLMGEFVLHCSVYFEPDSNLYGWLDNNTRLTTNEIMTRKRHFFNSGSLPYYSTDSSLLNVVQRGSVQDFLGIPVGAGFVGYEDGVFTGLPTNFDICADRLLTYLDIVRTYYAANQEDYIPFYSHGVSSVDEIELSNMPRKDLDDFFIWLRQQKDGVEIGRSMSFDASFSPSNLFRLYFSSLSRGGLFCAQYPGDMMRNLLLNVDTTKVSVVSTQNADGNYQFTIDSLRFQNKLQRIVDRYDISGGRFSSWLKTIWGARGSRRIDIPQFLGVTSVVIDPHNVTATATSVETPENVPDSVVGSMSGQINQSNFKGRQRNKNFEHYVHVEEPGTLCVIVSLVPKVDYSQGLERELREVDFLDDYKPQWANLGYQDRSYSEYSLFPNIVNGKISTTEPELHANTVVGKQIAWFHLMSDVNRVHGEFAAGGQYESYVLSRRYALIPGENGWTPNLGTNLVPYNVTLRKPSYYVDPRDWNYMYALTSSSYDNVFLQLGLNIRAVRPIGKRFMPNLE